MRTGYSSETRIRLNPNTYITGFVEFSVILPEIHWKCTKSQIASHVDVMFFLDKKEKIIIEIFCQHTQSMSLV